MSNKLPKDRTFDATLKTGRIRVPLTVTVSCVTAALCVKRILAVFTPTPLGVNVTGSLTLSPAFSVAVVGVTTNCLSLEAMEVIASTATLPYHWRRHA